MDWKKILDVSLEAAPGIIKVIETVRKEIPGKNPVLDNAIERAPIAVEILNTGQLTLPKACNSILKEFNKDRGTFKTRLWNRTKEFVSDEDVGKRLRVASTSLFHMKINRNNLSPGLAIIINNRAFESGDIRFGSEKDVEKLKETFKKLQLTTLVVEDPTDTDVQDVIQKVCSIDFSKRSCIVLAIMSHGMRFDNFLAKNDKIYSLFDDILFPLYESQSLKNTPKVVFIQACKGDGDVQTDSIRKDKHQMKPTENGNIVVYEENEPELEIEVELKLPAGPPGDVFIFNSQFEGYVSRRDVIDGSFFIKSLCKMLDIFGNEKSIQEIARFVISEFRSSSEIGCRQFPTITDTFSEYFFFHDYTRDNYIPKDTDDVNVFLDLANNT